MRRISTATKSVDKFGAGKHGFTNGNAVGGIPATDLEDSWFDHVQEEIANVIEDLGVALDPNNRAQLLAALKGRLINVQVFTASGTYTPTPGMKHAVVEVQGGGGAGGGAVSTAAGQISIGQAGSSGSNAICRLTAAQIGASQLVTVGAGGAGVVGQNGQSGGSSSFGALISCPGGVGGAYGGIGTDNGVAWVHPAAAPGDPSTSGTVLRSTRGMQGDVGLINTVNAIVAGKGAGSPHAGGAGGGSQNGLNAAGIAGQARGASGSAGTNGPSQGAGRAGGAGVGGIVVVREYA